LSGLPFHRDSLHHLPTSCGVYIFSDEQGKPIYVGKASDLRSRVRSYFSGQDDRLVTRHVGTLAKSLDFLVTGSTKEALILENSLIKKHHPRLNIRLKDDATYFSLRIDPKEAWPRVTIVRKRIKEDVLYFGPYPSARACRRTIQFLNKIFPIRDCPDSVLYNRVRPCIAHEIGQCGAPCVGLVTREAYSLLVERVIRFLSGKDEDVLREVEAQMHEAAAQLQFERAAELRDRLKHMRETVSNPLVARRGGPDRDVLGYYAHEEEASVTVLMIRDGVLANSANYHLKIMGRSPEEVLAAFLGQFYGEGKVPPDEIFLPIDCSDLDLYGEVLGEFRGAAVALRVPERGEGRRLLALAEENARVSHGRGRGKHRKEEAVLQALAERLELFRLPVKMECFDVSHFSGDQVVASQVVFIDGTPHKNAYRHFKLRDVQRNDDFAAMEEILTRRLKRGQREGDLPDLIVIDGGAAQLSRVVSVMKQLRITDVEVVGLAKARSGARAVREDATFERIHKPDQPLPIILPKDAPETHLLARLRDEAHRFAITFHRRLRSKERISTVLELVPGVGRRRALSLLKHFGSLAEVKRASREALAAAPLFNGKLADAVQEFFRLREDSSGDAVAPTSAPSE
jgi:excinuclease ABC subunit C